MAAVPAAPRSAALTVALCFAAALLEGLDIQAAGVAAPKLVPAFGLSPAGVGPLLVAPLIAAALPESAPFRAARAGEPAPSAWDALFGGPRAATTLLLWPCFFCTLLVLYLLMNWLPLLLVGKGFGRVDALRVSVLFNVGGAAGAVALGLLMDRAGPGARRLVMLATYAGVAASLVALARFGADLGPALGAGFAAGVFVIGAQLVLYGMAPGYYETRVRGTGVGAAVAAGRAGSVAGPLVAGHLLGAGASAAAVLTAILPAVGVAAATALLLVRRPAAPDPLADVTPRRPPAPPLPAAGAS